MKISKGMAFIGGDDICFSDKGEAYLSGDNIFFPHCYWESWLIGFKQQ